MYIFTIYIFIIFLSGNNAFFWLKHRSSHQFWIFHTWLLSKVPCRPVRLGYWMGDSVTGCSSCSPAAGPSSLLLWDCGPPSDSRHSCSGRSFHLRLALGSLGRGRAKAMDSVAFGLFLSMELLKDISVYSLVLWPWHIVWAKTAFLMSCCLMRQKFLLVYSVWHDPSHALMQNFDGWILCHVKSAKLSKFKPGQL